MTNFNPIVDLSVLENHDISTPLQNDKMYNCPGMLLVHGSYTCIPRWALHRQSSVPALALVVPLHTATCFVLMYSYVLTNITP